MKRILALFLCLLLLPALVVPASATSLTTDIPHVGLLPAETGPPEETVTDETIPIVDTLPAADPPEEDSGDSYSASVPDDIWDTSNVENLLDDIKGYLQEIWVSVEYTMEPYFSAVLEHWGLLQNWLSLIADNLVNTVGVSLTNIYSTLADLAVSVKGQLDSIVLHLSVYFPEVIRTMSFWGQALWDSISGFAKDFTDWVVKRWDYVTNEMLKYLDEIKGYLSRLVKGDTDKSQDFEDNIDGIETEASEALDELDKVNKPDPGDIDTDIGDITGGDSDLYAPLRHILESPLFIEVSVMCLTLALVSYVLYGKR